MNQIKFLDLKPIGKLAGRLNVAYDRVFNSGRYIGGKEVESFEQEWAEYVGSKYCIGVGNGHDALALACRYFSEVTYPIKPTVFTPWKTCVPTWAAARNGNLSPTILNGEAAYLAIAVHIYGRITIPSHKKDCIIIEDCAQAHGATLDRMKAGKFGRVAAWSFYPTKNLGALGDAGAITTDDETIAEYVREMQNYGNSERTGINSRLDPLQAAFLRVKLPYLNEWNKCRKENAQTYFNTILPGHGVHLPYTRFGDEPCWHIFAVETEKRDELKQFLATHNVETLIHYPCVPYPVNWHVIEAEEWTKRTLSLPIAPHVNPYICKQIGNLINQWLGV